MNIKKKDIKYYATLFGLLIMIILVELFKEKPIDWSFNLESESKEPYGTYVLYRSLDDLFGSVEKNKQTLFQATRRKTFKNTNFLFFAKDFSPETSDLKALLKSAENGNRVFISAYSFSKQLTDTLGIKVKNRWINEESEKKCTFTNNKLNDSVYIFNEHIQSYYFSEINTEKTKILGYCNDSINFIKQKFGEGYLFINLQTAAFTNFGMITTKEPGYAINALNHLPETDILWDTYYKPFKENQYSPLKYIFKYQALTYAWYIILGSIVLFVFFTGKRNQRIIPVINPLRNTSIEFTETLGMMYYKNKNHRQIALNKYKYFLEEVSRNYYIPKKEINKENIAFLEEKTSIKGEEWAKVFRFAERIKESNKISRLVLADFNSLTDRFKTTKK